MADDKLRTMMNAQENFATACSRAGGIVKTASSTTKCLTENGNINLHIDKVTNDVTVTNRASGENRSAIVNPDRIKHDNDELVIEKDAGRTKSYIKVLTEGEF